MRLLSGRARETEIKLSEGFQSGPGADSDLDSTRAKGVKEGGGPGQGSHTLIYFVACQMQLQPEQNKVSIPVRQGRAERGNRTQHRGQRAEHRGQWAVGSIRRTYRRCASLGQHARLPHGQAGQGRPVACDVDNTKLLVK